MMRTSHLTAVISHLAAAVIISASAAAGDEAIFIKPAWNYTAYKRAAVLPFQLTAELRDNAEAVEAARRAWFTLEDGIRGSSDFTTLSREDVETIASEHDFSRIADADSPDGIIAGGAISAADVLIVGVVTRYDTRAERRTDKRTRYAKAKGKLKLDSRGMPIPIDEEELTIYRHEALVGGTVHVIDAKTGKSLLSYTCAPVEASKELRNDPPRVSVKELGIQAARELGTDLFRNVAPQNLQVKFSSKMLVVAFTYYDASYDETKQVYRTQKEFVVAVRNLPWQCERHKFKLAVGLRKGRDIWSEPFIWSSNEPARGVMFRVPIDLLAATGDEKFELRLYGPGGTAPVEDRSFKLKDAP